jgi:hypothetical protein
VASTASGHLFVWSGEDGVFAARVSASGATLDAVPLLIRQSQNNKRTNVATNGRDFAVTSWTDEYTRSVSEIHRVSSGGEVSHIGTLQTGRTFRAPLIASDGSGYLVVWGGYSEARGTELLAARVSEAGELLDTTPLVVDADLANTFSGIALTFDGSAYLVLFQVPSPGEDAIRARRIAPNGTVSEAISTPWTGIAQGVGWGNGRGFLTRTQVDLTQLFGSDLILQGNAFMGASTPLTQTNNGENAPVVWDGKTFWVAWEDNRRGILEPDLYGMPSARDVYVGRFGPSATPLDPGGVRLAEGVAGRSRDPHPVLTHDGQNLLASYAGWDSSFGFGSVRLRWRQLTSADPGDGGGGGEGPGGTGGDAGGGGSGGSTGGSSPRGGSAGATSSTGGSDAGAGAGEAGSPSGGSGDVPTGGRASGTGGASSMSGAPASGEGGAEEPVRVARDNPSDGCSIRVDPRPSHRAPFFGALSVLAFGVASRRRATRRDR